METDQMAPATKTPSANTRPWFETGQELARVDASGAWRHSAATYSDWVDAEAEKLGLSRSNLWRYLAAVRYYEALRGRLSTAKIACPRLDALPEAVGPESLELLGKLERAMPAPTFHALAREVIGGSVRRAKLRELWLAFRPALGGQTARGRDKEIPSIDLRNPDQRKSLLEALVFSALSDYGPSWTGMTDPFLYKLVSDVVPERSGDSASRGSMDAATSIDLAAILQQVEGGPLEFHGVEIRGGPLPERVGRQLTAQSMYVHAMWLAVPALPSDTELRTIAAGIGLLVATKNKIEVVRSAKHRSSDALTGQFAKGLIIRLLGH